MRTTIDLPDDLHRQAQAIARSSDFATRPIAQSSLLRSGDSASAAREVVTAVSGANGHRFWAADSSFADVELDGVVGHRQVVAANGAA